jgi:hypothetical protein
MMDDPKRRESAPPAWKVMTGPVAVIVATLIIGLPMLRRPSTGPKPIEVKAADKTAPIAVSEPTAPVPTPAAAPTPPPAPKLDEEAVRGAKAALAEAEAEREAARRRRDEAALKLAEANVEVEMREEAAQGLVQRMAAPAARLARIKQTGAVLKQEQSKVRSELAALAANPRPRRKPLIDKSPVARPAEGLEVHFEVRHGRVAYIDLDRLIDLVKADAMLQMRLAGPAGRPVRSSVGPVGEFALRYEMGRDVPETLESAFQARGVSYSLRGWEVVPTRDPRGEGLEQAFQPASAFARAINTLSPQHATITMWVYPDGFALYRQLRDALHARGFLVAARPMPDGLAIRGSPSGSISSGQ